MAFHAPYFSFDGIPCTNYGLMLYDFGGNGQEDVSFPSAGKLETQWIPGKLASALYGTTVDAPLEFSLVFGAHPDLIDADLPFDRWDVEVIASWLTGHNAWKWLTIDQPDLEQVRFRCLISELRLLTSGSEPWAFQCKVTCDSPYAYLVPQTFEYQINGAPQEIIFHNRSSHNGYYRPSMELLFHDGDGISIVNHTDNGRCFSFSGLPAGKLTITVDNENQVITNNLGLNLYPKFNMQFFRLLRGDNKLTIQGDCTLRLNCAFPVNVGG